ncbi:GNAT family N-acetyltransferase [Bacillus sp. FJAT-53060]|uniref:GNAT family N-acetyltransferase n=1 Tax=Bacillus TaxID=1386 RepID=UPI001CF981B1|nr:GNAT family N-acetyltransferase [Bacillus stratosphericus]
MNLTTERCLIRPFTEDDWQDVYVYTSDPAVMKYIPEDVFSKEDAKEFVKNNGDETAKNFAVLLKEDHPCIGHM